MSILNSVKSVDVRQIEEYVWIQSSECLIHDDRDFIDEVKKIPGLSTQDKNIMDSLLFGCEYDVFLDLIKSSFNSTLNTKDSTMLSQYIWNMCYNYIMKLIVKLEDRRNQLHNYLLSNNINITTEYDLSNPYTTSNNDYIEININVNVNININIQQNRPEKKIEEQLEKQQQSLKDIGTLFTELNKMLNKNQQLDKLNEYIKHKHTAFI